MKKSTKPFLTTPAEGNFIQDYKVLTEARLEKGYRVAVQTTVSGSRGSKTLDPFRCSSDTGKNAGGPFFHCRAES